MMIQRRAPLPQDVLIDIDFSGVCHSDIHQARDEWGEGIYPMVPGHEIVGKVSQVGESVNKWRVGDSVGVSVFVDSCRECEACMSGEQQYCEKGPSYTYNSWDQDKKTPTYGGYSTRITVNENYVLRIPAGMLPDRTAPLLCAGITTYSPLRHFGLKRGDKIGVVGLGGLGHMGVKFAKAFGAEVTVVSHSPAKKDDAMRLGAQEFITVTEPRAFESNAGKFDFLLDTVSGAHDLNSYMKLLKRDGTMILVGLPEPSILRSQSVVDRRLSLVGSSSGGIRETQAMLDFCSRNEIAADVEVVQMGAINEAFERTIRGDVRYRFVIDIQKFREAS
ncbi:MAG: NAD(P)-dependent alcohol dehydrogenase [Thaumarchaeota archaeon]|nr:NAD(P)-dependent alcohol dehydrogenase [Nitrososphaerota archaeon]